MTSAPDPPGSSDVCLLEFQARLRGPPSRQRHQVNKLRSHWREHVLHVHGPSLIRRTDVWPPQANTKIYRLVVTARAGVRRGVLFETFRPSHPSSAVGRHVCLQEQSEKNTSPGCAYQPYTPPINTIVNTRVLHYYC